MSKALRWPWLWLQCGNLEPQTLPGVALWAGPQVESVTSLGLAEKVWECLETPSMVGTKPGGLIGEGRSRMRVYPGGECYWMEVDSGARPHVSHTLGFWNAAMGSLRNGPSLRRSLIGRAFWWHLGNMVSVMQAEGERKKHCIHLTRF